MQPLRALRLLRPLLAPRCAQPRRGESSCESTGPPPPCPPCAPAPRPPCRARPAKQLAGRRVVCCPPPQGQRPPCAPPAPACSLTCENHVRQAEKCEMIQDEQQCGAESDRVARRMRAQDEVRQRKYERDVEARRAAPPAAMPDGACELKPPHRRELATDGRSYEVLDDAPPPGCPAPPCAGAAAPCPAPQARHPPAQTVRLAMPHDCAAQSPHLDPCAHRPRELRSIDRSGRPRPSSPNDCDGMIPPADPGTTKRPKSPEPQPLPKKSQEHQKTAGGAKGLTTRIMESLGRGRAAVSPARSGRGAASPASPATGGRGAGARRAGDSGWCASLPPPAPAPPRCRAPGITGQV